MSVILRHSSIALMMSDLEVISIYRIFFYKLYLILALKKKMKKQLPIKGCIPFPWKRTYKFIRYNSRLEIKINSLP